MRVLVTGATGFIGLAVCQELLKADYDVRAFYRSETKALVLRDSAVELVKGDLLDSESIKSATSGCDAVIHCAAFTGVWARDENLVRKLNIDATKVLIAAARETGVSRCVFASTAGVFGPSINGIVTEETVREIDFFNAYERTKSEAETFVLNASDARMDTVVVNPTRVYGPGVLSTSNGITRMAEQYTEGKWHMLPGNGNAVGNYAYIDDVAKGHVLALEKGLAGQRYILGGENVTYRRLFATMGVALGRLYRLIPVPVPIMLFAARIMTLIASLTRTDPMITTDLVKKFSYQWEVSSEKAVKEIGYPITPLEAGIKKTVEWLLSDQRRIF